MIEIKATQIEKIEKIDKDRVKREIEKRKWLKKQKSEQQV
jgi:hypothetical protein